MMKVSPIAEYLRVNKAIPKQDKYGCHFISPEGLYLGRLTKSVVNNYKVEKKLRSSKYINNAKLHRNLPFTFVLEIDENKPLFYDMNKSKYVLSNKEEVKDEEISHNFRVPRLLNYVPDKKYSKFIKGMNRVDKGVLVKISDIEYQPNDYDKDRFLLYMDDGNMVYLTLTKFKMINHYNEVLKQLENHKGILYLDNGNHFQIKE